MLLIFTDLDGTLLDHDTYAWEAAQPALDRLRERRIPWIFVTSKTRAEVELWRRRMRNEHPFVVENGGAAYIPEGCLPGPIEGSRRHGAYDVLEWGAPYDTLVERLREASHASGCRVRGFHEMDLAEVASLCGMTPEIAALAKQREYDEPFVILDPDRAGALADAIEERGCRVARGGRFSHILGGSDKARAVTALIRLYERVAGPAVAIGLGDGPNDIPFLKVVSTPVIIRSVHAAELARALPAAAVSLHAGPAGWNDAVLDRIDA